MSLKFERNALHLMAMYYYLKCHDTTFNSCTECKPLNLNNQFSWFTYKNSYLET